MTFKRLLAGMFCALAMSIVAGAPADAQEKAVRVKIAVIDIDAILRNATAAKSIRKQIGVHRSQLMERAKKENEFLRQADQELARKKTLLSPEAFAQERSKFERRFVALQRLVQVGTTEIDKSLNEARNKIKKALQKVITDISNEQEFTLILRADQVVSVADALNLSQIALQRLDSELPDVKITPPSIPANIPAAKK